MISEFKAARRCGVPIVAVETADPQATKIEILQGLNGKTQQDKLLLEWDLCRAMRPLDDYSRVKLNDVLLSGNEVADVTGNPADCLKELYRWANEGQIDKNSVVFWNNAQLFMDSEPIIQGIWNLRDQFKSIPATLVLMCPTMKLPEALVNDIIVLTHDLPSEKEIEAIVDSTCQAAGAEPKDDKPLIIDQLLGLSAFSAEQTLAMSIKKNDDKVVVVDTDALWDRKCKVIEQTPGLMVWRGEEGYPAIGGCDNIKKFCKRLFRGESTFRSILFIDEIEKALAGAKGDMSGTSQDQLGVLLTFMQDYKMPGILFIGPPGAAKTVIAKATANEFRVPMIMMDLGAMKGSLVGESEKRIRAGLNVFKAISRGKGLCIATCNSITNLPPELRRRFKLGTYFFDLPTPQERALIWEIHTKRFGLTVPESLRTVDDDGWTGAEIESCCEIAWRCDIKIEEASRYIVPVCKSAAEVIEDLRRKASGRFISANYPGVYQMRTLDAGGRKQKRAFGE